VAALEHGSHTVSELAVVTGMRGPSIRENLRRLLGAGAVTRGKREGRAAYELSARR
jgi:DNA-binding transcriptional ArsR family regulator